jgi:outer membrane murein-binding lipoprotein Lpp
MVGRLRHGLLPLRLSRMVGGRVILVFLASLMLAGCTSRPPVDQRDINALAQEIERLGPGIDPAEARRAAEISFFHSAQLAQEYNITDLPIIHNEKVHQGLRERGLCNHWAEDLSKRLKEENFSTLSIQRAISPPTPVRIIHHTAVITGPGDTIYDGIVIDPWRHGGNLFWAPTIKDKRYNWRPRDEVLVELIEKSEERAARKVN